MVEKERDLAALSAPDREKLEGWLVAFDESWHENRLAEVVKELPRRGNPLRLAALSEMVKIDLERQWKKGPGTFLEK